MSYVLCLMSYVLCLMSCVLCLVSYVLCVRVVVVGHRDRDRGGGARCRSGSS